MLLIILTHILTAIIYTPLAIATIVAIKKELETSK